LFTKFLNSISKQLIDMDKDEMISYFQLIQRLNKKYDKETLTKLILNKKKQ